MLKKTEEHYHISDQKIAKKVAKAHTKAEEEIAQLQEVRSSNDRFADKYQRRASEETQAQAEHILNDEMYARMDEMLSKEKSKEQLALAEIELLKKDPQAYLQYKKNKKEKQKQQKRKKYKRIALIAIGAIVACLIFGTPIGWTIGVLVLSLIPYICMAGVGYIIWKKIKKKNHQ